MEFEKVLNALKKMGLVVVIGLEAKLEENLISLNYKNHEDSAKRVVGQEVMFVMVDPYIKNNSDFNQDLFVFCISRIRGNKLNRYTLDDGTIVVEGVYD